MKYLLDIQEGSDENGGYWRILVKDIAADKELTVEAPFFKDLPEPSGRYSKVVGLRSALNRMEEVLERWIVASLDTPVNNE